jgi:hypothetical protein
VYYQTLFGPTVFDLFLKMALKECFLITTVCGITLSFNAREITLGMFKDQNTPNIILLILKCNIYRI